MEGLLREFGGAYYEQDGPALAATITPFDPPNATGRLDAFRYSSDAFNLQARVREWLSNFLDIKSKAETNAWIDIFVAYWKFLRELPRNLDAAVSGGPRNEARGSLTKKEAGDVDWSRVYNAWKDVVHQIHRGYGPGGFQAWTIPLVYVAGRYLRVFAIKADEQSAGSRGNVKFNDGFQDDVVDAQGKNERLEDAARQINRLFSLCYGDRSPIDQSRKWGLYYVMNLLFKTYFKLNSIGLCKNLIKSLQASNAEMPPLDSFPKSHQVTYLYYAGVISFLEEDYQQSEEHLTKALRLCHSDSIRNRELILTYLIPCHLLTSHTLPSELLLAPYPRLRALFNPLAVCIKRGDLAGFDAALKAGEGEFVKRRIYLTLERGRDIALRNLFRNVFISGGWDEAATAAAIQANGGAADTPKVRRSRVPVDEFWAAVRLGAGKEAGVVEEEEVECMIANMIYKNYMKGYISRQHRLVVLSKVGAFPGTGV